MCFCRRCWRTLSTSAWGTREYEARPMMSCWMNSWRQCRTGTGILVFTLCPFPAKLSAFVIWNANTWCQAEKNVEWFSIVSLHALRRSQICDSEVWNFSHHAFELNCSCQAMSEAASCANGNMILLESDQRGLLTAVVECYNGIILSR